MRLFKDNAGRAWDVAIDINTIKRVRARTQFDLLKIVEGEGNPVLALNDDLEKLVDVMWAICEPQARGQGITDEDFGRALVGEAIGDAFDQLIGGLTDFFFGPKRRILIAAAMAAGVTIRLDEEAKLKIIGDVPRASCGAKSFGLRAALGWIQAHLPSANCR